MPANKDALSMAFLLSMFIWRQGTAQVDYSKALIWSTRSNIGNPVLRILHGDPQSYFSGIGNGSGLYNYSSVPSESTGLEFGVLDTQYSISTVYFYSKMKICFSSQFIPNTGTDSFYLDVIAVSSQVTGISIDWVSGLIFWSDALYQRICFVDIATYGFWRSVVDTNLTAPQDVIVYPQQSYLFWIDFGANPKIERLDLRTDERRILLTSKNLQRPKTLTIDTATQRLYWLDTGASTIGSMNFDGSGVSLWNSTAFSTVSSFLLYQNYCFLASSLTPTVVHIYDRYQRTYQWNITGNGQGIVDINMWSPERQPSVASPCINSNGGCDHFCITINSTARRCLCAMGFFLAPDGIGCITKPFQIGKFLMVSDPRHRNVFQIDVDTGEVRALSINRGFYLTAMTYDPLGKCFYALYLGTSTRYVVKIAFDNSYAPILFYANGRSIINMAFDSINRRLFCVDNASSTIIMFQMSTQTITTVLSEPQAAPTQIVLDTVKGFMYWSDCGSRTIERSVIADANNGRKSVVVGLRNCVTTFTVDIQNNMIYLADKTGILAIATIPGTVNVIFQDSSASFTGLAVDSRFLYIAYSNKRQIQKLDRVSYQITNLTGILFTQPFSILFYSNETGEPVPSTWTTMPPSSKTDGVTGVSVTTIVLASVISGSVVIVAVIITVGIIVCMKRRSKKSTSPVAPYELPPYTSTASCEASRYTAGLQESPYSQAINFEFTGDDGVVLRPGPGYSKQLYQSLMPDHYAEIDNSQTQEAGNTKKEDRA